MKIVELISIRLADGAASVLTDGALSAPHNALRVRIAATHVGYRNTNGFRYLDGDPTLTSLDSWTKPYPKPVITHHDKERDPLGRVYHAERQDFIAPTEPTDTATELPTGVVLLDALITDADGIRKVLTGEYLTVSVKSHSDAIRCSICDTQITPSTVCEHKRNEVYDEKICSWDIGKRDYKEVSFVNEPADESDTHFAGVVSVDADSGTLPSFLSADDLNDVDDPGYIVLMDEHHVQLEVEPMQDDADPTEWTDDDLILLEWLAAEVEKELGPAQDAPISEKTKKKMSKEGKTPFCGPMDPRKGRKSFPVPDCCLTGDTKIRLLDGTEAPISELVGRNGVWVYGFDLNTRSVVPAQVGRAWLAVKGARIFNVKLDTGRAIRCTGNHPFLLRSGEYKSADTLQPGDSLMPLYTMLSKTQDGFSAYEKVYQPVYNFWEYTHRMVVREAQREWDMVGKQIHHKNDQKRDNRPDNLESMSKDEHIHHHFVASKRTNRFWKLFVDLADAETAHITKTTVQPVQSKRMFDWTKPDDIIPGTGVSLRNIRVIVDKGVSMKQAAKSVGIHESTLADWLECAGLDRTSCKKGSGDLYRSAKLQYFYEQFGVKLEELYQEILGGATFSLLSDLYRIDADTIRHWFRETGMSIPQLKEESRSSSPYVSATNHKVVSVEQVGIEDAYDMEVPATSNFALSAGVFVHNSHVTAALRLLGRYTGPGSKSKIRACVERRGRALGCSGSKDDVDVISITERLQAAMTERDALRERLSPDVILQHETVVAAMSALTTELDAAKQTIATLQARTDTLEDQIKTVPDDLSALRILEKENATLYALIHRLRAEQLTDLEIRAGQHADIVSATDPVDARVQYVTTLMDHQDSAALATAYRTLAKATTFGLAHRPNVPTTTTVSPGLVRDPKSKKASPSVIVRSETGREKVGRLICKTPVTP